MPRQISVNGETRDMTAEEEAAYDALQAGTAGFRREGLRQALQRAYERRLLEGFAYTDPYQRFALDEASQRRITSAYSLAGDAEAGDSTWPASFAWRSNDNSYLPLPTPADCKAFCRAAAAESTRLQFLLFAKKDALAAVADADLDSFDPTVGWE
jgi:hypothetical protein